MRRSHGRVHRSRRRTALQRMCRDRHGRLSALGGVSSVTVDLDTKGVSQVHVDADTELSDQQIGDALAAKGNFTVAR